MDDGLRRAPVSGPRFADRRARGSDPAQAGFTLIELLVVVAVLAVLAVGASLAATRGARGTGDAAQFAQSYAAARALAVQGQDRRGLRITPRGHRVARRVDGAWTDTGREARWRGRVAFAPSGPVLDGEAPEIVFLPNGRTSAFSIRFGGSPGVRCSSDGWKGLSCSEG